MIAENSLAGVASHPFNVKDPENQWQVRSPVTLTSCYPGIRGRVESKRVNWTTFFFPVPARFLPDMCPMFDLLDVWPRGFYVAEVEKQPSFTFGRYR